MSRFFALVAVTLALADVAAAQDAGRSPATYGTSHISYQRIGLTEFTPADSSMTYTDSALFAGPFSRYPTNANGSGEFFATVHLPSGALVEAIEFDYCDTNADSDLAFIVESTSYTGENGVPLAILTSSGSAGCAFSVADLSANPFQMDNNHTQLVLVAIIPTQDGTLSISGAIVRYFLQVSPAPKAPDFNDVPPTDFGYQYIEALFASGITGGCGGGSYCPDSPVTRRQMAIFLAKALGLQFQ